MNEWINDKGVCRTALATPGLLKIALQHHILDVTNCHKTWSYNVLIVYMAQQQQQQQQEVYWRAIKQLLV